MVVDLKQKCSTKKFSIPEKEGFVIEHVFTDVMSEEWEINDGKKENHFNVSWKLGLWGAGGHWTINLFCLKYCDPDTYRWFSIDTNIELKIGNDSFKTSYVFSRESDFYVTLKNVGGDEMKKYLVDDNLKVECHVEIKNIEGTKKKLCDFGESVKGYSDVVLIASDEKFCLLKKYLSQHSSGFKSVFSSIQDNDTTKKQEIALFNCNKWDFQNFLEVLYGLPAIDEDTVEGILDLTKKYTSETAIEKCEEFLIEKSQQGLRKKFELAVNYNMDKLKEKCFSEIKTLNDVRSLVPEDADELEPSVWKELLNLTMSLK